MTTLVAAAGEPRGTVEQRSARMESLRPIFSERVQPHPAQALRCHQVWAALAAFQAGTPAAHPSFAYGLCRNSSCTPRRHASEPPAWTPRVPLGPLSSAYSWHKRGIPSESAGCFKSRNNHTALAASHQDRCDSNGPINRSRRLPLPDSQALPEQDYSLKTPQALAIAVQ